VSPPLSTPVVVVFFVLTNLVFYFTLGSYTMGRRLQHGRVMPAVITHKWAATRWGSELYLGYSYVGPRGKAHNGSARICATGAELYRVGDSLDVVVDEENPERSGLRDRTHLSWMETFSSHVGVVLLTGLFCLFGWWQFLNRLRLRWRALRDRVGR
jgi:hypothetical protein